MEVVVSVQCVLAVCMGVQEAAGFVSPVQPAVAEEEVMALVEVLVAEQALALVVVPVAEQALASVVVEEALEEVIWTST